MHISELHVYPVKGAAGIAVPRARLDALGLAGDRRFMVVDKNGEFITQRERPELTLLETTLEPDILVLRSRRGGEARIPLELRAAASRRVRVWDDEVDAVDAGDAVATVITAHLGSPARLVYMPDSTIRSVDPDFSEPDDRVSFADGFPLLLITQESLDTLNARLAGPIPMLRFRPNIVVAGATPHAEDTWRRIRIGDVACDVVKPCARCTTTTVDIATGVRGREPLRTLNAYRAWNQKVWFGQNVIHRGVGEIAVGAEVAVIEAGAARPPLVLAATA